MGFWNNVLEECEYRGISRKELAQGASFSVHTISNGLKRDGMPAADIALRISKFLEIPLEKLLDETTKKTNIKPILVENLEHLKSLNLDYSNIRSVSITSGASTPENLVNKIIEYLENK